MARHGRHKRLPQSPNTPVLPSAILPPGSQSTDSSLASDGITFASPQTPLTTVTSTFAQVTTIDGIPTTSTSIGPVVITDSAVFSQLTASEASKTASSSSSRATSSKASSSTTASATHKSSSNLGTLIPAIVIPVVVILLASFGLFWFFMRRRHRKELKNAPEFAMTGKGEKLRSRSNSSRSETGPSSFGVVEKKEPLATVVEKPMSESLDPWAGLSRPSKDEIGIARPLTLQDSRPSTSNGPNSSRWGAGAMPGNRPYQNFNEPRPSTARQAPPSRNGPNHNQGRNRSNSSPSRRRPPGASHGRDNYGTGPSPVLRSGPMPAPQSRPDPSMGSPYGLPSNPRSNNTPTGAPPGRLRIPSPAMGSNSRAGPPAPVRPPPPGAFNGASPISQYSPIVKDNPSLNAAITPVETSSKQRSIPPPIQTGNYDNKKSHRRRSSDSSPQENGLTEENMRIARLANSSRLGFTRDPAPSPKLPPPATRSQLIPFESPGGEREQYFTSASHSRPVSHRERDIDRDSLISEADEYEDIDVRSDVSSLDDFERSSSYSRSRHTSAGGGGAGRRSARHTYNSRRSGGGRDGSQLGQAVAAAMRER